MILSLLRLPVAFQWMFIQPPGQLIHRPAGVLMWTGELGPRKRKQQQQDSAGRHAAARHLTGDDLLGRHRHQRGHGFEQPKRTAQVAQKRAEHFQRLLYVCKVGAQTQPTALGNGTQQTGVTDQELDATD